MLSVVRLIFAEAKAVSEIAVSLVTDVLLDFITLLAGTSTGSAHSAAGIVTIMIMAIANNHFFTIIHSFIFYPWSHGSFRVPVSGGHPARNADARGLVPYAANGFAAYGD